MPKPLYFLFLLAICSCVSKPNSPCILQATYDSSPSTSSFSFNKDGSFEWINGSGLGTSQREGRYIIKDSIIMLDKIGFDKIIKSKRLLIADVNPVTGTGDKCVVQVNEDNKVIDSTHIFRIYLDARSPVKN